MMDRSKICSGKACSEMFLVQDLLTSPARRRMIDSLNDGLELDFVYNFLCVHRPRQERCKAGVFEKLIRILLLMNISSIVYRYYRYHLQENSIYP